MFPPTFHSLSVFQTFVTSEKVEGIVSQPSSRTSLHLKFLDFNPPPPPSHTHARACPPRVLHLCNGHYGVVFTTGFLKKGIERDPYYMVDLTFWCYTWTVCLLL